MHNTKHFAILLLSAILVGGASPAFGCDRAPNRKANLLSLLSRSESEVQVVLGEGICEETEEGRECSYADSAETEIFFRGGKAERITVNYSPGICGGVPIRIPGASDSEYPESSIFCVDPAKTGTIFLRIRE
jgi:hypothetical protein